MSAEFDMSRSRSYQLLDQGRVVREIQGAVSTKVDIDERAARDIKPHLDDVTDEIQERIAEEPGAAPARVRDIVGKVIDDHRKAGTEQPNERTTTTRHKHPNPATTPLLDNKAPTQKHAKWQQQNNNSNPYN